MKKLHKIDKRDIVLYGGEFMLVRFSVNNFLAFNEKVEFNLLAKKKIKRFVGNTISTKFGMVLKSAGIYGANNTGKTSLLKGIMAFKAIIQNKEKYIFYNIFNQTQKVDFDVDFIFNNKMYNFTFSFDMKQNKYVYEEFSEYYKPNTKRVVYKRDYEKKIFSASGFSKIENALKSSSQENIAIYTINTDIFKSLGNVREVLLGFADSLEIINLSNIPVDKTIAILKNDPEKSEKITKFLIDADLYLERISYEEKSFDKMFSAVSDPGLTEDVLRYDDSIKDQLKLVSVYKGRNVPSFLFDSTGTKKMMAIASYIIEAIEDGKTLIIDELESSLHSILTRSIVSMFNNDLNTNSQLLFTTHDIQLMDSNKLFRKDQIWFTHKDDKKVYLYSLADFRDNEDNVRTKDLAKIYYKGILHAIPNPKLINTLIRLKGDKNE